MEKFRSLGIISGTSIDGLDMSLICGDGHYVAEVEKSCYSEFPDDIRNILRDTVERSKHLTTQEIIDNRHDFLEDARVKLTDFIISSVNDFLGSSSGTSLPDLIACHGQTITHRPEQGLSLQILDPNSLASMTGIQVVADFRNADVKNGGQGAPLAPFYHFILSKKFFNDDASVFCNIGGISNVTFIRQGAKNPEDKNAILAFDSGPGNVFCDIWSREFFDREYDKNGDVALNGKINIEIVSNYMKDTFFSKNPPKSLDINDLRFPEEVRKLTKEDAMATLAAITAASISKASAWLDGKVVNWVLCGGGRKNKFFKKFLEESLGDVSVKNIDDFGFDGDFTEAECLAHLGIRKLLSLPSSSPSTTACKNPVVAGEIYLP